MLALISHLITVNKVNLRCEFATPAMDCVFIAAASLSTTAKLVLLISCCIGRQIIVWSRRHHQSSAIGRKVNSTTRRSTTFALIRCYGHDNKILQSKKTGSDNLDFLGLI
jgi:hypothetical protein